MTRLRGFIRSEGERRRRRGRRETATATTNRGRERIGRGTNPWRTPSTTTISTAPSTLDRVILLLIPKTTPRTTMTRRGSWWEYFSSGYAQWDTWRP